MITHQYTGDEEEDGEAGRCLWLLGRRRKVLLESAIDEQSIYESPTRPLMALTADKDGRGHTSSGSLLLDVCGVMASARRHGHLQRQINTKILNMLIRTVTYIQIYSYNVCILFLYS